MSYELEQKRWLKLFNLKVGSKVKVNRMPNARERNWNCGINNEMVPSVGEILNIRDIDPYENRGIILKKPGCNSFFWPWFVLEPVVEKSNKEGENWYERLSFYDKIISLKDNEARKKGDILYVIEEYNKGKIMCVNEKLDLIYTDKFDEFELYKEKE